MSSLLILGAGEDQVPAYRVAAARGMRTIGVDMKADAPGRALADRFLHLTTREPGPILDAVRGVDIAGVIAPAGDAAQPALRALARSLGLPAPVSELAARCSSDKGRFRVELERCGLPTYASHQHHDFEELAYAAASIGYPVMVKPSDSSGSKGITRVNRPEELPGALTEARRFSASGEVIVEEYVDGRHLAAECFLAAGELRLGVLSERINTGPPAMITISHRVPAPIAADEEQACLDALRAVAAHLDLHDGPLNADIIIRDGRPYIVEIGTRLGGNGMPQLVSLVHGVNTYDAAISLACGEPFDVTPQFSRSAILHILHTSRSGVLRETRGIDQVWEMPGLVDFRLFVEPGDRVLPYTQAANKLGYVLLAADRPDQLDNTLRQIVAAFDPIVDLVDIPTGERA